MSDGFEGAFHLSDQPVLFCLHFLGGSAQSWDGVVGRLGGVARCVAVDLPGFGDAAGVEGYSVGEMAEYVAGVIRGDGAKHWYLAGHSMGAKVAGVVARWAEDGAAGLEGLAGVMLVAGSPPGPEPMGAGKREEMLGWFGGDAAQDRAEAEGFIRAGVVAALPGAAFEAAVADALRAERAAWRAWLLGGSLEDWSGRVGRLAVPALIVAGTGDGDLGVAAQETAMAPHFPEGRVVSLAGGHLLPMEVPGALAGLMGGFMQGAPAGVSAEYFELMQSGRVSSRTRGLLLGRVYPEAGVSVLGEALGAVLRAMVGRLVPQRHEPAVDIAGGIEAGLAAGVGDGWRFADLPRDVEAYRAGLAGLGDFCGLTGEAQDGVLRQVAAGEWGSGGLDAAQMALWFEDVLADAMRVFMAHPGTLSWLGYSGIGYGGDGANKPGFQRVGVGEREDWEPLGLKAGGRVA